MSPIPETIVFAPDLKVTTVDDRTATLTGGYVAKWIEHTVLVGGAGYWLVSPRSDTHLGYAGLLLGWRVAGSDRLNLTARGLLGAGQATIYREVSTLSRVDFRTPDERQLSPRRVGFTDTFFVAEPEAVLQLGLTSRVFVNLGGGYRVISAERGFGELLRGPTATISVQFRVGD
ncbi:MAG: hypothetical protein ABI051_14365 [Vicinamibacterales bacterium]